MKFLFECLHLITYWLIDTYPAEDKVLEKSLTQIDSLYESIHAKALATLDTAIEGKKPADLWLKLNQRASEFALIAFSVLPSTDSKFFAAKAFQDAFSSSAKLEEELPGLYSSRNSIITAKAKKNLFKMLKKVPSFEKIVGTISACYLYSHTFHGLIFTKIFETFSSQINPETVYKGYKILLEEQRQEDTYLAAKL